VVGLTALDICVAFVQASAVSDTAE
jgi:hypothetical protein